MKEIKNPVGRRRSALASLLLITAVFFDEVISLAGFPLGIPEWGTGPTLVASTLGLHALLPWRWLITFLLITLLVVNHRRPRARWVLTQVIFLTAAVLLLFSIYNAANVIWVQRTDQILKLLETVRSFFVKG